MATKRDPKRRPTHPGAILREDVLPSLGLTQTECAHRLGVSSRRANSGDALRTGGERIRQVGRR
jgi:plasmid maintenance system antidote protein VapI